MGKIVLEKTKRANKNRHYIGIWMFLYELDV